MERQKILNLLTEESYSKFVTRKWNTVNDPSHASYDAGNEIIYNTEVLKSDLWDFKDAYLSVKSNITIAENIAAYVAFKNCVPFHKCIPKINGTLIDDAEDLDLVMPVNNLMECTLTYSEKAGLWFYSKDEATDFDANFANDNNFKSFKYKT